MSDDTPEPPDWSMETDHWEDQDTQPDEDWYTAHLRDQDALDASLASLATYTPPAEPPPDDDGEDHTTYWPVDLAALFRDGYEPQQPELHPRADGQPLLYRGKCHACNGEGESGKSWFLLIACLQAIRNQEHVLYLDYEDVADTTVTRIMALGATTDEVVKYLHYMQPTEATFTRSQAGIRYTPAFGDLHTIIDRHQPALVVIDGVTEVMWQHNLDPNKNGEFTVFHDNFTRPLARKGPACAYIDHVTKDKESRGKYAIGGVHKFNVIDGAVFSFQPLSPFGVGRHGSSRINVQKDRPGQLRQHTPDGKHMADLHLISDPVTHALTWEVRPPGSASDAPTFRPTHYMEQLWKWVAKQNESEIHPNARQIDDSGLGAAKYLRQARALLVAEGFLTTTPGSRNSLHHYAATPYTEQEDPLSDKYEGPDLKEAA